MIYILVNGEIEKRYQDEIFPGTVSSFDIAAYGGKAEDIRLFDHESYRMFRLINYEDTLPDQYLLSEVDEIPNDIEKQIFDFEHRNDPPLKFEPDNVNHPSHYETGKFECIDVMLETQGRQAVINFCVFNAFKYLYRHGRKNGVEDLKKARWYLDKAIGLIEGTDDE